MIHWVAKYLNGDTLPQLKPDQTRNNYQDIDRANLINFNIFLDDRLILVIDFSDDTAPDIGPKRLIWRMRGRASSTGDNQQVHLAGWQRLVKGKSVQSICYITQAGTVILSGQWQEDKPMLHAPAFKEFEIV